VHYMAHHTNLVVQPLSGLKKKIILFSFVYNYFVHNPKWQLELNKLVKLLERKGNINLKNVKKYWILMICHYTKESWLNTKLWLWRWLKTMSLLEMPKLTMNYCMMLKHC
jgi:hypothetical protein